MTFPPGTPAIVRANPALPAELSLFLTGINQLGDPADAVFNGFDVRSPNALLENRFGPVPNKVLKKVESYKSVPLLNELVDQVLTASSLKELGLLH